ncbi:flocculation protein FLO11-like isoform X2 [Solanum lycopersicum]|uniref:flocculation protein FLO11-like isoform X2 n=2 Tax=Solanum lycopersicum TaxID=4081 RepID=UPI0037480734
MDLEVNEFSLIDFSSENDNLIGNSSSPLPSWGLEEYPSSGAINIQEGMDMAGKGNNDEQFPQLHESKEPEKARRKGKVNLRKSLAWDSAFFTDAGVLDADELSCMIKGGDKQTLPMIEEDVRQSLDSISTLESDNLTLEHIESELFGDIRASIQKVAIPTSGDLSAKTDNVANSSAKKVDLASKDRMKPIIAPKRTSGAQAGIPKSQPKQITGTQRLGKGLNQDKAQVTQSISRTTSVASLKPPKVNTKLQPVYASKRASLDITRVKSDNDSMKISTASVRGAQTPKASALNKTSRVLPKPATSMKPSSVGSSPAMKMHAIRSSSDSSGSTSSDKTAKSSIPVVRRKIDSKPIAQPSASAKLKTPSKAAVKSKLPSGNSAVSAYLMSSKINANISPASSISEWSSVSSSSSAIQRSSKLRTSFDTSSCRSFDSDTSALDINNQLIDQKSDKPEIRGTTLPRESSKQAGSVSRPASMMKPTGLRMPSPKMGYFDGVKAVRTPNGTHSNPSTALYKKEATICSPKVNSNTKAKSVKVPLRANRKPETLKHLSPLSSSDKSNISDNHSGTQSSSASPVPKTETIVCSPKGNSNTIAKSVRVPLRANKKPETLKHRSPASSSDKSNVSDNHIGGPSDITLIPELSLEVQHEISGANIDVLAEEPDPFEHIQSAGWVATQGENQGIASALNSEEDMAEGRDTVEHVADASLVATKSENQGTASILNNEEVVSLVSSMSEIQGIASKLNNEEVVAEGPDTVEHVADASLLAAILNNGEVVAKGSDTVEHVADASLVAAILNNEEVLAEGPGTVEHVADDSLVAAILNNEEVVAKGFDTVEHVADVSLVTAILNNEEVVAEGSGTVDHVADASLVSTILNNEEVVPEGPVTVEHVADYSLVAAILNNEEVVAEGSDTVEHAADASLVAAILNNEEVVAEGPDTVEHVADDGLVAIKSEQQVIDNNDIHEIKSENQIIANTLNNEVVAEVPEAVEHIAGDALFAIESENEVIVKNDTNVIKSEYLRLEEVVADEPDTVEHVACDGLVAIKTENKVTMNNDTNVINSEHQRIEEVVADEPDTVEHVAGNGLVAIKSENQVIVTNDTDVIMSEHQRIEEVVADEPVTVEHVAGDGLVVMKSENQVTLNNDTVIIKSESQRVASTLNNKDFVAEGPDTVEDVPGDGFAAIESENHSVLNNDPAGLAAIKGQKQGVMENEMNLDTIEKIDIKPVEVSITENIRRCQTEDEDGVGVQCNGNYNLDVPSQMNEMNLEDNENGYNLDMPSQMDEMNLEDDVNGDLKHTRTDHVEREYDSTFRGDEGRVDVKDDLNTPEKTNAKKYVCANQADQSNSQVEEVSMTPFSNKVESLMNKLAYLSLNTPQTAVRRIPFAVKNSSGDCLDFCEGAGHVVGKTDLDLPSLQIDHKENNNL